MMAGKRRAAHRQTSGINQGRHRFIEGIAAAGAVAAFVQPGVWSMDLEVNSKAH
jgi:hypothetical protein